MTRLGIFGGTFDPPHTGHLLAATDAVEALALDAIWFVPNATQPLKGAGHGSPRDRLEMVRLMVAGMPGFAVDSLEIDRQGLSYTVETVRIYAERYPAARRFLLIGSDVTTTFGQWREPGRIREFAEIAVLQRPDGPAGEQDDAPMAPSVLLAGATWLQTRRIELSSTEVRERVRAGKPIRGFVPDAVAEYIAAAGLYR